MSKIMRPACPTICGSVAARGNVGCARCGGLIAPGSRWDLDHAEERDGYLGPSHQSCNVAAANRRRAKRKAPQPQRVDYNDDPSRGIFWGPPSMIDGKPTHWSRPWYDWRALPDYAAWRC